MSPTSSSLKGATPVTITDCNLVDVTAIRIGPHNDVGVLLVVDHVHRHHAEERGLDKGHHIVTPGGRSPILTADRFTCC